MTFEFATWKNMCRRNRWFRFTFGWFLISKNLLTLGHMAPLGLLKKMAKLVSMSIKI